MARFAASSSSFLSAGEGSPMTQSTISAPPPAGAPAPIFTRGKTSVPRWAMMFLMPLWPPALPEGRTRSLPTGRETSS